MNETSVLVGVYLYCVYTVVYSLTAVWYYQFHFPLAHILKYLFIQGLKIVSFELST